MAQTIGGMVVSSSDVDLVVLEEDDGDFTFISQATFNLQVGARAEAYRVIQGQIRDQLSQTGVTCVCVKASALSMGGTKKVHLEAAELRGVTMAAAAAVCDVRAVSKSATSRNFGGRGVDEYLKDDSFWVDKQLQGVRKGMREAAFMAISQFSDS